MKLFLVLAAIFCTAYAQSIAVELNDTDATVTGKTSTGGTGSDTEPPKTTETTRSPNPTTTLTTASTPEPPITTTEAPPQSGPWVVNKSGDACIVAKFGAEMKIEYIKPLPDNTTVVGTLNLPSNASVNENLSSCDNNTQILVLEFVHDSSLTLTFKKDGDKVFLNEIKIDFKQFKQFFPDARPNRKVLDMGNLTQFSASNGHSYYCSQTVIAYDGKSSVTFTDIQIEAFRRASDEKFSLAEDCDSDVSNIVPIAVGCALAGLVVIVLIAYLVGRRHKRQRGYESV